MKLSLLALFPLAASVLAGPAPEPQNNSDLMDQLKTIDPALQTLIGPLLPQLTQIPQSILSDVNDVINSLGAKVSSLNGLRSSLGPDFGYTIPGANAAATATSASSTAGAPFIAKPTAWVGVGAALGGVAAVAGFL